MAYKYGIPIGLKNIYAALLAKDDQTGASYGKPIKVGGAITVKPSFEFSEGSLSADDMVIRDDAELMGIKLQINASRISLPTQALLLGHKLDANGGLLIQAGDTAPECALLYQVTLDTGKSKYVVIYKGAFRDFTEESQTKQKGGKAYQTPTIEYSGYQRSDGKLRYEVSEDTLGYNQAIVEQWFDSVQEPAEEVWAGEEE